MRTLCLRVVLTLLSLLASSAFCCAQNPGWGNVRQLSPGQQVRVEVTGKASKGEFQSASDDAMIIRSKGAEQTISRANVRRVSFRHKGHRGRNALIGGAIGAGAGLGAGAAIDNDCSANSIVCTGNKGKAILTPVFGLVGAIIGAVLPSGSWQEVYRSN